MQTIYQCEWDKHATSILNRHWPQVPKWGDITTLTATEILRHGQNPDVVAWGSPCQDLSVAGKRAGLAGERSGLFHEGIRLIKELRKETNNEYPRISIWENVAGAMSSNSGSDFGAVLDEMAEAGAMVIEWAVLDAQHFGIPQRRRRVFVIAIFDPAIAERCPDPLLPVSESVRGDTQKGKQKGKATTGEIANCLRVGSGVGERGDGTDNLITSLGSGSDIANTIPASLYHKSTVVNQDLNNGHMIIETVGTLAARDYKGVGNQYVNEGKLVVEPFVKSRRAQTSDDDETWVEGEVNPTLNSFDVGETRTTTAVVGSLQARDHKGTNHEGARDGKLIIEEPMLLDGRRVDDVRIYEPPVQTLQSRMGTGGNNVPMLAFDTQFGSNANVFEDRSPTLKSSQQSPSVAYGIQGNVIGRQPQNGPAGKGHTEEGDPMFTLTSTDTHAIVQYDGYNQKLHTDDVSVTLRIGRDSSDFVAQPTQQTMAVRRLTPLECERLMGWPDDHTRWKADGTEQADTHRYKQCGNGVASPVARWIAQHLLNI
jgi:DNA (cytosine-5)-methyltransferase 1